MDSVHYTKDYVQLTLFYNKGVLPYCGIKLAMFDLLKNKHRNYFNVSTLTKY